MSNHADKLAKQFILRQAEKTAAPVKTKTPPVGAFADLAVFAAAFDAYIEYIEAQKITGDEGLIDRGQALAKRSMSVLTVGLDDYISPIMERPEAGALQTPFHKAQRSGSATAVVRAHADFYRIFMPWLRTRPVLLQDTFTGKSTKTIRQFAQAVQEEAPAARLNQLAAVPPASTQTLARKWIIDAAAASGLPLKPAEGALVDAIIAKGIGQDLATIDAELSTTQPNTPKAVALKEKKAKVVEHLERVAQDSADPATVMAVAASAQATTHQYATETAKKTKLSPDQEAAMMGRGKIIIAAGAGSGKCIHGNTLVQTGMGFIPIEELCAGLEPEQDRECSLHLHSKTRVEETSHVYYDGFRQTLRIETAQGYEIEGTAPHKILTMSGGIVDWKTLQELQVGDVVCIDRRPGLFSETLFQSPEPHTNSRRIASSIPRKLDERTARLLGYLVSEGYFRESGRRRYISLVTTDKNQADLYREALTGIHYHERMDTRHNPQWVLIPTRLNDIEILMGFGLSAVKAQEKEIPFGVLRSPKPIITEFLKALFDGDGGVTTSTVEYCTASETLAYQLHTLLLAYGIPSRRKFRPNSGSGAWHLIIGGLGLRRFASEIGFNLQDKQTRLQDIAAHQENTNIDVVPDISSICQTIKKQYQDQHGDTKTADPWYGTAKCYMNGTRRPSAKSLTTFLEFYKVDSPEWSVLQAISQGEWFYDYVQEITESEAHVYDFVVPFSHSFSAGGFINHNTKTLASKVAYHIDELGVDPSAIMATTFTNKAAGELVNRVKEYGVVLDRSAMNGFGTTHAVAGALLDDRMPSFKKKEYIGKGQTWKQASLVRLAMAQVQFDLGRKPPAPPPLKGIWDDVIDRGQGLATKPLSPPPPAPAQQTTGPSMTEHSLMMDKAINFYEWAARTWSPGPADWARNKALPFIKDMKRMPPDRMSVAQKQMLNNMLAKIKPAMIYRVAEEQKAEAPTPRQKRPSMEDYTYYGRPADQWFNLGLELTTEAAGQKKQLPMGQFKNAISILKGKGLSPIEAWYGKGPYPEGSPEAAVYAAYEWLKSPRGEPEFAGMGDMDDLLIDAVSGMVGSPQALKQIQAQYKVLLIDEAQDLNRVQHLLFGLAAGQIDPKTLKPKTDGSMTADTFALIGDDKQCVSIHSQIDMAAGGTRRAGDLQAGDGVKVYRNGAVTDQKLAHAVLSDWDWGYRITTESGRSTTLSPNHKLWATEPQTKDGQVAVYLMYRPDMGFRVGITNKGKIGSDDDYLNSYGGRCFLEKAERLWVLDICQDRDEALLKETQYSLRYGIPTTVFNGEHRELNIDRIEALFKEFGNNGIRLLEERDLSPALPHWMAQSYTKHGRERHIITLIAHSGSGTQVSMEWTGDKFDESLAGMRGLNNTPDDRRRLRRWFANYRDALAFAEDVAAKVGAPISHKLSTPEGTLRKITASGLHVGMSVPVRDGMGVVLDPIVSIEPVKDQFIDLDVDDASNFFADGILTSNSIYEFRGADPDEFIEKSDMVDMEGKKGAFATKILDTNYRSGQAIVEAANHLISYNKKQVPMVCKANLDRNGLGAVVTHSSSDTADAAVFVAEDIEQVVASADAGTAKYKDFGIGVRSNAEAYHYGIEMIKRGIPFKSNAQFFNDPSTKAIIGWLTLAEKGIDGPIDDIADAVEAAAKAPRSMLGEKFWDAATEKAHGMNVAKWLVEEEGWRTFKGNWASGAEHFAANLEFVFGLKGSPERVVADIMTLRGVDGKSMQETMIQSVMDDDEAMSELAAASESGVASEDQITEQALAPVEPLLNLMKGREHLGTAMSFIRKLQKVNEKVSSKDTEKELDRDAVTIGTMHSWKGLEVPHMFVPMVGGKFPRSGPSGVASEEPALWSERRLAYVAITRAEKRCVLLDIPGIRYVKGAGGQNIPVEIHSQFLQEVCAPPDTLAGRKMASWELEAAIQRDLERYTPPEDWE